MRAVRDERLSQLVVVALSPVGLPSTRSYHPLPTEARHILDRRVLHDKSTVQRPLAPTTTSCDYTSDTHPTPPFFALPRIPYDTRFLQLLRPSFTTFPFFINGLATQAGLLSVYQTLLDSPQQPVVYVRSQPSLPEPPSPELGIGDFKELQHCTELGTLERFRTVKGGDHWETKNTSTCFFDARFERSESRNWLIPLHVSTSALTLRVSTLRLFIARARFQLSTFITRDGLA